jgi:hypothetical protein
MRLCFGKAVLATCLLLVLAAGATAQIAAQSSISVDLTLTLVEPNLFFDTSVNGVQYCIVSESAIGSSLPSASQLEEPNAGVPEATPMNGEVYEGPCSAILPTLVAVGGGLGVSDYRGAGIGDLVGHFTSTVTLDLPGGLPGDFTFSIVFDLEGGLHIESKITGTISDFGETGCMLENMVSEYAFVTGAGLTLRLQLLTHEGACTIESDDTFVLHFPTLTFAPIAPVAPVGGFIEPVRKLTVLASYLALFGVVAAVAIIGVRPWKRES